MKDEDDFTGDQKQQDDDERNWKMCSLQLKNKFGAGCKGMAGEKRSIIAVRH